MKYVTGIHALNLPCSLDTSGDWHKSGLRWKKISFGETEGSLLGEYGIEGEKSIPETDAKYPVANHIRALLDLLIQGNFAVAQGMNKDFIANNKYNKEIFDKISLMRGLPNWKNIDKFVGKEYKMKWIKYKKESEFTHHL